MALFVLKTTLCSKSFHSGLGFQYLDVMKNHHLEHEAKADSSSLEFLEEQLFVKTRTPAVVGITQIVTEIAPTPAPVLVEGETGTGKEILALRIHRFSPQHNGPFMKVLASLQTPKAIQQLRGAGNGEWNASSTIHAGTIFFDHIDELDLGCQSAVTQLLSEWTLRTGSQFLSPRLITSTRRSLEREVRFGAFREDLYYRLNGICLHLPPLRHRREDLPALIDFFLTRHSAELGVTRPSLSPETIKFLTEYRWPGNLMQLERIVRKIVVSDECQALAELASFDATVALSADLPRPPSLKAVSRRASRQAERELILRALERTRWNRKRAAQELQISYKALLYKLKLIGAADHTDETNTSEGVI